MYVVWYLDNGGIRCGGLDTAFPCPPPVRPIHPTRKIPFTPPVRSDSPHPFTPPVRSDFPCPPVRSESREKVSLKLPKIRTKSSLSAGDLNNLDNLMN